MEILAIATIIMSIPLPLSFIIKYPQWLPAGDVWGWVYGCLFFWGLLSIWVLPLLLLVLIILTVRITRLKPLDRSPLKSALWGIAIALLAEMIFMAARLSPSSL
jgi:hypothetical protein